MQHVHVLHTQKDDFFAGWYEKIINKSPFFWSFLVSGLAPFWHVCTAMLWLCPDLVGKKSLRWTFHPNPSVFFFYFRQGALFVRQGLYKGGVFKPHPWSLVLGFATKINWFVVEDVVLKMRFRLVLPEEYPDQGPGGQNFLGGKTGINKCSSGCCRCTSFFSSDLYFTSDVFHPMVESSIFARWVEMIHIKKFMAAHLLKREFIIPQFIPSSELTYPLPKHVLKIIFPQMGYVSSLVPGGFWIYCNHACLIVFNWSDWC